MSIEKRIFYGITSDLEDIIAPRIKRSLKALIIDARARGNKLDIVEQYRIIQGHYQSQLNLVLAELYNDIFAQGLIEFSGYKTLDERE